MFLLKEEIFIDISDRKIPGYHGIRLLRRNVGDAVEFVTIMRFDSLGAVRQLAGEEYEAAVIPPKAQGVAGSGLGLSLVRAIVERHGGQSRAAQQAQTRHGDLHPSPAKALGFKTVTRCREVATRLAFGRYTSL